VVIIKVPEGQTAEVLESQEEEVPEEQAAKVEAGEQAPKVEVPEHQEEEGVVEAEMHNSDVCVVILLCYMCGSIVLCLYRILLCNFMTIIVLCLYY
jgi:hypothetical protein